MTLPRGYKEWLLSLKERVEEAEVERLKEVGLEKIEEVVDSNQGLLFSRGNDVGPGGEGQEDPTLGKSSE